MYQLEFEKPVNELKDKIHKLKEAFKKDATLKEQVDVLNKELIALKKQIYSNLSAWQKVQMARHPLRPHTLDYIDALTKDFMELHGDRISGEDKAIVGGFALLEKQTVMVIGHQKGRTIKENQFRNFGMPNPEGYRKSLRLMKLAEKFNKAVITLIDTPGASTGLHAEQAGQAEAIGANLQHMMKLKVPVIALIIGEASSGGALALAVADRLLMLENSWFSVVSPEACSSVLWKSTDFKEEAATQMRLTANDLLKDGIIDDIIHEPQCGAHNDPIATYRNVKKALIKHLDELKQIPPDVRIRNRVKRFSEIGIPTISTE